MLVATTDSDAFIQGSKNVFYIQDLKKTGTAFLFKSSVLYPKLVEHYNLPEGTEVTPRLLAQIATLLGCDYCDGCLTDLKLKVWLPKLVEIGEANCIKEMAKMKVFVESEEEFKKQYDEVINHILSHPVFVMYKTSSNSSNENENDGKIDLASFLNRQVSVSIGSHNAVSISTGNYSRVSILNIHQKLLTLEAGCGFSIAPAISKEWETPLQVGRNPLLCDQDWERCFFGDVWTRTFEPFEELKYPIVAGKEVYHGAVIDFDSIAPENCPDSRLKTWLNARNKYTPGFSRDLILALIQEIRSNGVELPVNSKYIADYEKDCIGLDGDSPFVWEERDTMLKILRDTAIIPCIDDKLVDNVFGRREPGVRFRAVILAESGHFCKYRTTKGTIDIDGVKGPCQIVNLECHPSMKKGLYSVHLVFANGKYQPYPASRCKCPDGFNFCSHMLGGFLLMSVMQDDKDSTYDDIISNLPPEVTSLLSLPTPVSYYMSD